MRAVQTAEIFAAGLEFMGEVKAVAEFSPGRDPGDLVALLTAAGSPGPIALIGHEPSLSQVLRVLAGETGIDGFKKGGLVAVSWEEGKGTVVLALNPLERNKKSKKEKKSKDVEASEA